MVQHGNIPLSRDLMVSDPHLKALLGQDLKDYGVKHNPEADRNLIIKFFTDTVYLPYATQQLGHVKIAQSDFLSVRSDEWSELVVELGFVRDELGATVMAHGSPIETPDRYEWRTRFPEHWALYQQNNIASVGTPLSILPSIGLEEIEILRLYAIATLEGLSDAEPRMLQKLGGKYVELSLEAKKYLEEHGELEEVVRLKVKAEQELADARATIEKLMAQLVEKQEITDEEKVSLENSQLDRQEKHLAKVKLEKSR